MKPQDPKTDFVLDEIRELRKDFKHMNEILAVNTESLRQHIRRTDLNEEMIVKMNSRLDILEVQKIEKAAIKKWLINTAVISGKVLAGVGAVIGAVAGFPIVAQWLIRILTP